MPKRREKKLRNRKEVRKDQERKSTCGIDPLVIIDESLDGGFVVVFATVAEDHVSKRRKMNELKKRTRVSAMIIEERSQEDKKGGRLMN